jgi:hypothetical protein
MTEGDVTGCVVARLVYKGAPPFAELVDEPSRKIRLNPENLRLLEEGAASRPLMYYHRGFVVAP